MRTVRLSTKYGMLTVDKPAKYCVVKHNIAALLQSAVPLMDPSEEQTKKAGIFVCKVSTDRTEKNLFPGIQYSPGQPLSLSFWCMQKMNSQPLGGFRPDTRQFFQ
jgi:hypothetical protein